MTARPEGQDYEKAIAEVRANRTEETHDDWVQRYYHPVEWIEKRVAELAAARGEQEAQGNAYDGFYRAGEDLPVLHDDPLTNRELQVQALCARLDTARAVCAQAAAMQVVTPTLQKIKANAVWAMHETAPARVMPRSYAAPQAREPVVKVSELRELVNQWTTINPGFVPLSRAVRNECADELKDLCDRATKEGTT